MPLNLNLYFILVSKISRDQKSSKSPLVKQELSAQRQKKFTLLHHVSSPEVISVRDAVHLTLLLAYRSHLTGEEDPFL